MHDCVVKLLKNHDEESLECLCRLLTTIGKDLDFEKAKVGQDQKGVMRLAGQRMEKWVWSVFIGDFIFSSQICVQHEEVIHSSMDVSSLPGLPPPSQSLSNTLYHFQRCNPIITCFQVFHPST